MLSSKTKRAIDGDTPIKEHLLITRYNPSRVEEGHMLSLDDIQHLSLKAHARFFEVGLQFSALALHLMLDFSLHLLDAGQ
jgi:hypothetical protein